MTSLFTGQVAPTLLKAKGPGLLLPVSISTFQKKPVEVETAVEGNHAHSLLAAKGLAA